MMTSDHCVLILLIHIYYFFRLPYFRIFGGVSGFTKEQFTKANGFSNQFFGWRGEDGDMWNR